MDRPAPALVIASTQPYQGDAKQRQAEVVVCSNLTATGSDASAQVRVAFSKSIPAVQPADGAQAASMTTWPR